MHEANSINIRLQHHLYSTIVGRERHGAKWERRNVHRLDRWHWYCRFFFLVVVWDCPIKVWNRNIDHFIIINWRKSVSYACCHSIVNNISVCLNLLWIYSNFILSLSICFRLGISITIHIRLYKGNKVNKGNTIIKAIKPKATGRFIIDRGSWPWH